MKIVWLLYRQEDLSVNRDYARLMRENGLKRDIKGEMVLTRSSTAPRSAASAMTSGKPCSSSMDCPCPEPRFCRPFRPPRSNGP